MNILVTGGADYIGSLNNNHSLIIVNNLCDSKINTLDKIRGITNNKDVIFYQIGANDALTVESIFNSHPIDDVINFESLKAVGESVAKPLGCYYNSIVSTVILTEASYTKEVNI